MARQSLIINLIAGPGAGKSTVRAGLFYRMKVLGIDCEEVHEWVKGAVWEERHATIPNQLYIFGKQLRDMERVIGKVDVVITDSPVILCRYYGMKYAKKFSKESYDGILEEYRRLGGINIFIERIPGTYRESGRMQKEDEAIEVDREIKEMLAELSIPYWSYRADQLDDILAHCRALVPAAVAPSSPAP